MSIHGRGPSNEKAQHWAIVLLGLVAGLYLPFVSSLDVGAQEAERRMLQVEDQFAIQNVGAPQISPEGTWIAYTVTSTSLEKERSETRVWISPFEGGEAIPMTVAGSSAGSPRFSPDGRYLSFTASRGGDSPKSQVWALDRRGGEARPLTSVKQGVSSYAWSPDGQRLALLIRDEDPESVDSTRTWTSEQQRPYVIDRLQFKRDGRKYLNRLRVHLYVYDLASEELVQLTDGDYDNSQPRWSPDGTRIAFVSNRTEEPDANANSDIWVVPSWVSGAQGIPVPRKITTNPGSDSQPAWSPDGQWIAHVTSIEPELIWYATNHLAVVSADGGEARVLTAALDRNLSQPKFDADGRSITAVLEDSSERHLARIDVASGGVERIVSGGRSVRGFDRAGGNTVVLVSEPHLPREVFAIEQSNLRRVTHVNTEVLDGLSLGTVRNIQFDNPSGIEIEGFLTTPPDYEEGRRYPTILRLHGGPVSQYDHAFNFEAQMFAANGYVVLNLNPRGSSGYGQDFSAALFANWGVPDVEDVLAGVDYAIAEGFSDPERLGVGGWSYGGILTNYVITKSERFDAAITGASEVLYRANYGHDHYQRQWEGELGLPWENAEAWERISPFNDVAKVVTPTLVMGGEDDWNVPIQNSEQLYQALKRLGIDTQLVVYPGQSHGISVPSYRKDRHERYLAWYDRLLKPESRPVS